MWVENWENAICRKYPEKAASILSIEFPKTLGDVEWLYPGGKGWMGVGKVH